jgi:hypothetical protein
MPQRPYSDEELQRAIDLVGEHPNVSAAARAVGIPVETLRNRVKAAQARQALAARVPHRPSDTLDIPEAPREDETLDQLIARKAAQFKRIEAAREFNKLVNIGVREEGPIIIAAIGDPHTDDDRCDIEQLMADMRLIGRTKHMHALHLGDVTNNWIGRLEAQYAHQRTTASDGIRLVEAMFKLAPPLAVVGGNHDIWKEGMSWLNFCTRQAGVDVKMVQEHGVRLSLDFPGGKSIRLHARHDFPGGSMWNPSHAGTKENYMGHRDHIKVSGHRHISAAAAIPSIEGYTHWILCAEGYKRYDSYAASKNFREMRMGPTVALLIDPSARVPAEVIKPFWDLEVAADYLAFLRRRKAA